MGYSYLAINGLVLDEIQKIMDRKMPDNSSSNKLPGGFWEHTRKDREDGAITGTIFKETEVWSYEQKLEYARKHYPGNAEYHAKYMGNPCKRAGSFKIADGRIVRFPYLTKEEKRQAELAAAAAYFDRHGIVYNIPASR